MSRANDLRPQLSPAQSAMRHACPACAQQPGEWCAEWVDHVGMVEKTWLIHPERYGLDTEGSAMTKEAFRSAAINELKGIM